MILHSHEYWVIFSKESVVKILFKHTLQLVELGTDVKSFILPSLGGLLECDAALMTEVS